MLVFPETRYARSPTLSLSLASDAIPMWLGKASEEGVGLHVSMSDLASAYPGSWWRDPEGEPTGYG